MRAVENPVALPAAAVPPAVPMPDRQERRIAIANVLLPSLFGAGIHYPSTVRQDFDALFHGVDLFFALSGFLISNVLLQHRDSPNLLRTFYARRLLHIVPGYAVLIDGARLLVGHDSYLTTSELRTTPAPTRQLRNRSRHHPR